MKLNPPKRPLQFLRWFCREDYLDEIEGDLVEVFIKQSETSPRKAKWIFGWSVIKYFRPEFIKSFKSHQPNTFGMYKSYFKIGWRGLIRNQGYSFINIGGLAMGMAVALLIGLWIHDELTFNTHHGNFNNIARVMQRQTFENKAGESKYMPFPLGVELNESYGSDFDHVVMSTFIQDHIIAHGDVKFNLLGYYMQPGAPNMLSLKMLKGTGSGLKEMNSILLSESTARALFGDDDPINKVVRMDDRHDVKVTGVYENLPTQSDFNEMSFLAPWDLYITDNKGWLNRFLDSWRDGMIQIFVQVKDPSALITVETKIRSTIQKHLVKDEKGTFEVFLHPMTKWHLYEKFENGQNVGGQIQFVWLFGIIGGFVLLLACINFMNLSTARSEKRAKEVGVRKAIGSARNQLVGQFLSESVLIAALAFVLAVGIVLLALPWFNEIASKQITIPWLNARFWGLSVGFVLFTGMLAGSYPALFLSSFQPVKVLKGTFRAGRFASVPRQVLVVLQFTVSVVLTIGTIVVYQQIQYTMKREVGYNRDHLIYLNMKTSGIHNHFDAVRAELINAGAIVEMSESNSASSQDYSANFGGFQWQGKDPDMVDVFGVTWVTPEYGKTIGWQVVAGRDFSREIEGDKQGMVINESAATYMGLKDPVGEVVKLEGHPFIILGVVKDLLVGSPYETTRPAIYSPMTWSGNIITIKLNSAMGTAAAIEKVKSVFQAHEPAMPFDYKFIDEQYARKFTNEVRIGKLAFVFAGLAILISCLGLFGLASYIAEQRTKEIGIRKILGASVVQLWQNLSRDFIILVALSCAIAVPLAWYFMKEWLFNYEYHISISWWVLALTSLCAIGLTLFTVSLQAVKAAMMSPVKSLRSE